MSARAIRCSLVLVLLMGALAHMAGAQKAGAVDAMRPQATIRRSTAELPAEKGTDVVWSDLLRTNEQGRVRVMLLDRSLISVGPKSEVRIAQRLTTSDQSNLELAYGKVRMRLAKQSGQRFELRTPTAVAGVIGTDFGSDASVPGHDPLHLPGRRSQDLERRPKNSRDRHLQRWLHDRRKGSQPPAEPTPATAEHMENWRRNNEPDGGQQTTDHTDHH